jgi:glycosyltransferase involved in cell wall biosynthesis
VKIILAIKALNNIGGGAERVFSIVSSVLAERGHEVIILSFDGPGYEPYFPINPLVKRITIGVGDVSKPTTYNVFLKRMIALRNEVLNNRPDVVIGFMHSMFIPLGFSLIGTGIPVIASEHTVPEHYHLRPLEKALLFITPLITKCIVVVSEQVKEGYSNYFRKNICSIPNPVTISLHEKIEEKISNKNTLLAVGSLTGIKDHKTLLKAFSIIADDFPDWNLRIIGDGSLKQELDIIIKMLGFENRVQLPGNKKSIHKEYARADIFIIPSLYESFSLATAEALSYGVPAIGFEDCPGVNQLIESGKNGILAAGDNRANALANALKILMTDKGKRKQMGNNARLIKRSFGKEKVVSDWEVLLMKYCK